MLFECPRADTRNRQTVFPNRGIRHCLTPLTSETRRSWNFGAKLSVRRSHSATQFQAAAGNLPSERGQPPASPSLHMHAYKRVYVVDAEVTAVVARGDGRDA